MSGEMRPPGKAAATNKRYMSKAELKIGAYTKKVAMQE
jgi:hypothetical protein